MRESSIRILVGMTLLSCTLPSVQAQQVLTVVPDLSPANASDWTFVLGEYALVKGELTLSDREDKGAWAFYNKQAFSDCKVSFQYRSEGWGVRAAGIALHSLDSDDMYYIHLDRGAQAILLKWTKEKPWGELVRVGGIPAEEGVWRQAAFEIKGDRLTASVAGKEVLTFTNKDLGPGLVGFRAGQGVVRYKDIRIEGVPAKMERPWTNDHPAGKPIEDFDQAGNPRNTAPAYYQDVPRDPSLKIEVSEPFTISTRLKNDGDNTQPHLWRLRDGTLLCDYHWDPDIHFARRVSLRSTDNGKTWTKDPQRTWREDSLAVLRDGKTVLSIDCYALRTATGQIVGTQCRSADGGKTFGPPEDLYINMPLADGVVMKQHIPDWYPAAKRDPGICVGAFWRSVVELDNGDLLATMHTLFKGDKKLRSVILRSADKGLHWEYLSTVAADEKVPTEGFVEPVMVKTPQRYLVCVMRTDGFQPLVMARSTDDGKTWQPYEKTGVMGVDPDLEVLDNGVVACSFGRPNVYVMFSADGSAKKWTNVTKLYEYGGPGQAGSFGYTGLRQIAPNTLLLVWDQMGWREKATDQATNTIRAVTIKVTKTTNPAR